MNFRPIKGLCLAAASVAALVAPAKEARAYQVDCAILLCLSGGWPASAPCAHARAVFIRRITPWPIEPPLQIWRCPMGIAHASDAFPSRQLFDLAFTDAPPPMQSYPQDDYAFDTFRPDGRPRNILRAAKEEGAPFEGPLTPSTSFRAAVTVAKGYPMSLLQLAATEGADIDISDPAFDFVRSIRVWDVRHFSHRERGRDDDCSIHETINLGTYGPQGEFSWRRASYAEAPSWVLPITSCTDSSYRRGVGVEWRDYEENEGNEWVSY